MPRIFDNINEKLQPALEVAITNSVALDASVGYFNIRGWSAIMDEVETLIGRPDSTEAPVRLLIGMRGQSPSEELRRQLQIVRRNDFIDFEEAHRLAQLAANDLREQLVLGIPNSTDARTIRTLLRQLKEGRVKVKLFLRHNLHAKLYLLHRSDPVNPKMGFLGSSNLTFSGLHGQGELNVDVMDVQAAKDLSKWFDDRWGDELSLDITDELIRILEECWAGDRIIDPYLVHLKLAFHLSRDARAGISEFGLPESMANKLLEYQASAVMILARNLMRNGGAIIGDVVGLGKTIVATATALLLEEQYGHETLVICPKNLKEMWKGYMHSYGLRGEVLELSMVPTSIQNLRRFRTLIIDESHNLRNSTRQDYQFIRDYISANDPKVLLLTATPYNRSMEDVANQLSLFIDDDHDLGIRPEAHIELVGEYDFLRQCDDKPSTIRAFSKSSQVEDWQKLLSLYMVRRTRSFIKANYGHVDPDSKRTYLLFADGSKHFLPERKPMPLPFEWRETDPSSLMVSEEALKTLDGLSLPRYHPVAYLKKSREGLSDDEVRIIERLERAGGNLIGFTRTMLLKRLSSNGAVYISSLQRHLIRNHMWIEIIENGGDVPIGSTSDREIFGDRFDVDEIDVDDPVVGSDGEIDWRELARRGLAELKARPPRRLDWLSTNLFEKKLLKDLKADTRAIEGLLADFGKWDPEADSKMDALVRLLEDDHANEKVLIFTEYADSALYIHRELGRRGVKNIDVVTGESERPTESVRKFSPRTNGDLPGPPITAADETRVLIATDVLSEGQNLQDAAIVVNFDMPWAIIRLIQRAGRVDRIGQKATEVRVYTFLPSTGVEALLKLRKRIADRLASAAQVLGADERFLNTPDEVNIIHDLFNGKLADDGLGPDAQVDFASAALEIWKKAISEDPTVESKVLSMMDGSHSTRRDGGHQGRSGVLVYTLSELGVDRIAYASSEGNVERLTPHEALNLTKSDPSERGRSSIPNHYECVGNAVNRALLQESPDPHGALTGLRKRVYERLREHIEINRGTFFEADKEIIGAMEMVFRSPLTEVAKGRLARRMRDVTIEGFLETVRTLAEDRMLVVETAATEDELIIKCLMGFGGD